MIFLLFVQKLSNFKSLWDKIKWASKEVNITIHNVSEMSAKSSCFEFKLKNYYFKDERRFINY